MTPHVEAFFDQATNNITYVVSDPAGGACAVIDSVLDFDSASGRTGTAAADKVIAYVRHGGLETQWILETHVHADHLTASAYLKDRLGGRTGIGEGVTQVQEFFKGVYNSGDELATDGSQFDHLFGDGESFAVGGIPGRVIATPGHTPACVVYHLGDAAFTGDTLFMPDAGTARCDFPGGCASQLYRSIQRILALPGETRLFINHDYGAGGNRAMAWQTTVAEQKAYNIHVGNDTPEEDYVKMRIERDNILAMPRLILPAIQVNIRAGHLPPAEDNGMTYLKLPLNAF